MKHGINPATGKRYDWVDPDQAKKDARAAETAARREAVARDKAFAEQHALLRRRQKALLAREKLLPYIEFTMPHPEAPNDVDRSLYQAARYHQEVAKALEAVERGEITQLIFCMPPRHGKTEMATKRFAAWISGKHPEWNIAVGAYSDTIAEDIGADTRAIMNSPQHKQVFPEHGFRKGGSAKSNIQTTKGGRLVFVGRGGALTGRGMHVGLCDDLYKDHEEARSPAIRDQAWNWFTKVFMTRRMGLKLVILTMTRWHSDDVIGRLTDPENPHFNAEEAKTWKIIRLPALAEEDDPLGRAVGEALWPNGPDKFDVKFLESQRRIDPLGFSALYQQSPTVADGILFLRENIVRYDRKDLPESLRIYCSSDHAVATGQRNDPSCFIKVGVDQQDNIFVLECFWRKVPSDTAVEAMLTMAGGSNRPLIWWAERGHISRSIGPFLNKRMRETGTYINIREVTPVADKQQRAQSIAARVAMGKVAFPKGEDWADRAVEQMLAFPNGIHDDFVDALAYIGLGLGSIFAPSRPAVPEKVAPQFGTLAWVKMTDTWKAERDRDARNGGF